MCAPDAPDTSRQDAVAERMQGLSEEQWKWVQQKYNEEAPQRVRAANTAEEVARAQLDQMKKSAGLADESAADYRRIYRPLEEQAALEARGFDSEAKQAEAAGRAVADVRQQAAIAQGATERSLASMGVNPSDGAYAATTAELQNQTALNAGHAANTAREQVKTVGRALRQDAIGVGRGVVGSQGTQAGLTLTAGNSATGNAAVPVQIGQQGVDMVSRGAGQAISGLGNAANIYANSSNAKYQADAAGSAGLGSLAGAGMTAAALAF